MRHVTHDKDIMKEVSRRCAAKFPFKAVSDVEWNLTYDHVLCDHILDTIDWKLKYFTPGTIH